MADLIPFYPYTIACAYHDNKKRVATIHLSSESHVDWEERDSLEIRLKELLRIYNRCKRKKTEFNVDEAAKQITWGNYNIEPYIELANRVKAYGKKATIDGIHLKMHEYYRQCLVDEMITNDLNPCDYGDYERFVNKE